MAVDIAFEDALTRVNKLPKKLKNVWGNIVDGVNDVLSILPGFLAGHIKAAFKKCSSKVTKVLKEIAKLFSERGSASALRTVGESWNEQVGHRASTQAGLLTKETLETDNEWTGAAADRYAEAVTAQGKTLTQIKTITDTLQQQATMDGQFANGDWPSAVAEKMSDASVRDGDTSDWTPQ